jgi:hypothetical protein
VNHERKFRLLSLLVVGFWASIAVMHFANSGVPTDSIPGRQVVGSDQEKMKIPATVEVDSAAEVERMNSGEGLPTFTAGDQH